MREGLFPEALELLFKFRAAHSGFQLDEIGVCLWCTGQYQAACDDWVFEIERYNRRESTYADFGAVTVPSLLWWASAHADLPERDRYRTIAIKTLKKRAKTRRVQRSGRSFLVAFLLGTAGSGAIDEIIEHELKRRQASNPASLITSDPAATQPDYAVEDLEQKEKWQLHEAHFYRGAKVLAEGDIARYRQELAHCLENIPPKAQPIEHPLVRHELQRVLCGDANESIARH